MTFSFSGKGTHQVESARQNRHQRHHEESRGRVSRQVSKLVDRNSEHPAKHRT